MRYLRELLATLERPCNKGTALCCLSYPSQTRLQLRFNLDGLFCPQNWLTMPSWSANFDDTASNAVSSRLSGLFQLGNFFIFPLMTNAVFTQRCGLEPRQSHFMRNLRCGKHTCRMKALRFSKNKYHKNLSAGSLVLQNQRSGAFVISGGELMSK